MKLYNVGADLSKKTIDFVIHQLKVFLKVDNNISGFKELIKWFLQHGIDLSEVMIVMEHTGLYSYQLEQLRQTGSHKIMEHPVKKGQIVCPIMGAMRIVKNRYPIHAMASGWIGRLSKTQRHILMG